MIFLLLLVFLFISDPVHPTHSFQTFRIFGHFSPFINCSLLSIPNLLQLFNIFSIVFSSTEFATPYNTSIPVKLFFPRKDVTGFCSIRSRIVGFMSVFAFPVILLKNGISVPINFFFIQCRGHLSLACVRVGLSRTLYTFVLLFTILLLTAQYRFFVLLLSPNQFLVNQLLYFLRIRRLLLPVFLHSFLC